MQGHARRAHVEDGGDEVDRAQDRRGARDVQREDRQVERRPRVTHGRQRRIGGPPPAEASARPAVGKHRQHHQHEGEEDQPERDVVQAREGHVRRPDHDRDEIVAEAAHRRRHDDEEHHDQGVRRDRRVVAVLGRFNQAQILDDGAFAEHLDARLGQLPADQARQSAADEAGEDGEHQV
ncbi:hypothetical protein FQZ97_1082970 [compost metagenome]